MIGVSLSAWATACTSFSADGQPPVPPVSAEAGADVTIPVVDDAGSDAADASSGKDASPAMVEITTMSGTKFAIDATEVTVGSFFAFKATQDAGAAFPDCPGKVALGPKTTGCRPTTDVDQPMSCVDWCDAKAYCESVGKRLCGKIGGGRLVRGTESNPQFDEWSRACAGAVGSQWPYGGQAMPLACNTQEASKASPVSVATLPKCVGGEPLLFDMSGNVDEWEDACVPGDAGTPRTCLVRGGSFRHLTAQSSCTYVLLVNESAAFDDIGIRCCKDL